MTGRTRISASIDSDVAREAQRVAATTPGSSFSAWVNDALAARLAHDEREVAWRTLLAEYEQRHGEITDDEIVATLNDIGASGIVAAPSDAQPHPGTAA